MHFQFWRQHPQESFPTRDATYYSENVSFDSFVYFQAIEDAPADKLTEDDKKIVRDKCQEALSWLDGNQLAEKDEFEHKLKELQQECSPVMMKLHQGGAAQGGKGPTVEEVD